MHNYFLATLALYLIPFCSGSMEEDATEHAELLNSDPTDMDDAEEEGEQAPFDSSHNFDSIDPDLVATIAALGSFEGKRYVKGDECAICIGDLIKFLRIENRKDCDIRRQLARTKVMEKDLLPILTTYYEEQNIVEAMMRLLVNLTMPALLCFEREETRKKDKIFEGLCLDVNNYLRHYKSQFVFFNVMKVFSSQLGRLLELGKANRTDDDDLMLERLLIIIRNILHVPADSFEDEQLHNSLSVHDKLVLSIIEYGVADLLFYLCGSKDEEQHCLLSLEIISLVFRDFESSTLARQNTNLDAIKIDEELKQLKMKEDIQKQKRLNMKNSRHSRFGGTFVVKGKKSITDKDLIYHKNIKKIKDLSFDDEKTIKRHTGFNAIAEDSASKRLSTAQVRNSLKELAQKFLDVCYNPLMKKAKSLLCRGQGTADCDESFYLWACCFFMEFNRVIGFQLELVAETLSSDTFSYILQIIFKFHEEIKGFSARMAHKMKLWAKRLHFAVKAYREMLENLALMQISKDTKIKNISGVIQNIIFYQQEYRELPTILLKQFNRTIFTKSYLTDLVECTHLYIKMLDAYTKSNTLIVQQTKKIAKKKRKPVKKKKNMLSEREMQEMWDGDIEAEVMKILSAGSISTSHVRPFDASSEYSMEQQRVVCKHSIQDLLKSGSFDEAAALYKAAQEVWPSSPSFGMPDMAIIDEVNVVKSIFLSREEIPEMMTETAFSKDNEDPREKELQGSELHHVSEHKFQNNDYLMLYARPQIVKCYCYLLEFFETNSPSANHATVKMLYRLASKIAMSPLMYQISFFVTLKRILSAPKVNCYKDLQKFAVFLVRKYVVALKESPLICLDAIFWKTPDDVIAIDNGYDPEKLMPKQKVVWTPQEEEEVKSLFEKWLDKARAIDICDMIAQDMTTSTDKQRIDVKRKILELGLVSEENSDILKKKPKNKVEWLPDEREALKSLYEEYKYDRDPVALIQEKLDTKSRKRIMKELESLLGVRKADLDVNRSIWTKDDDEELKILYDHKSETHTGDALLEIIQDKIPKNRTIKEIKEALIRLRLQRDENSSVHFWTKAELAAVAKFDFHGGSKKDLVLKIKLELPHIDTSSIIQQLVRQNKITTVEGADLLIEVDDEDSDEEDSDEENEEEYDFFEFPKYVKKISLDHSSALSWIADICQKVLDSREDMLDYDTVFIIAREEGQHEALRDHSFQEMLKCLGAVPPLSSYETYWKITSDVSDNILRKAVSLMQGEDAGYSDSDQSVSDLNAEPDHQKESQRTSLPWFDESEDDNDDMDAFFSKMRSQNPDPPPNPRKRATSESHSPQSKQKMSRKLSSSADEEQFDKSVGGNKENSPPSANSLLRQKQTVASDSDSETTENVIVKKRRTAVIDDSDSE